MEISKHLIMFSKEHAAFGHWIGVYGRLFVAEIYTHNGALCVYMATQKGVTSARITPAGLVKVGKTTPWKDYYPCQH